MAELKPCPFCGEQPIVVHNVSCETVQVMCKKCNAIMGTYYRGTSTFKFTPHNHFEKEEEAIEAWNKRANDGTERKTD